MAEDMKPKPSVVRMVHYKPEEGRCFAAIVTQVYTDERVNLAVFPPMAHVFNMDGVTQGTEPDTWHWPERV